MIPIRDTIPNRTAPLVTWTLIAVNTLIFLYQLTLDAEELRRLFYLCGIVPARYTHPEWARWFGLPVDDYWPFLTTMFLHGGWVHLIGNMWTLWIFGDNVEDRMGRARFLAFYLLTGVAAGLTHWLTNPHSTIPAVGASGAIAGVLGAYFFLFPHARVIVVVPVLFLPFFFYLPAVVYLLFWFLSQVFGGAVAALAPGNVGGIAWWAHIGGFVAGMALYRLFLVPQRRWEADEWRMEQAWM